jgi:hypothetical protein
MGAKRLIVITRAKLKFLRGGRTLSIPDTTGRYKPGRDYALGLNHRTTICRVQIIKTTPGHIHIQLAQTDPPRLLAAKSEYGYTTDPNKALANEPEAIRPAELERINNDARARRQTDLAQFRDDVLQRAEALTIQAGHADARRLRSLTRVAASLATRGTTATPC